MFVKVLGTLVLLGFMYAQLGSTLQCFSCYDSASCAQPPVATCTNETANATSAHLHTYFKENLTNYASNSYACFGHNLTITTSLQNVTYRGCIYSRISPCELSLKDELKPLKYRSCYKCTTDRCNQGNPAGTFSSSSLTIFTSIVVVTIFKLFKM